MRAPARAEVVTCPGRLRRRRVLCTVVLGVGVLSPVAACGDDEDRAAPAVTEPGTSFEVGVGDTFTVVLESNATTGYAWSLETEPPADVVRLRDDRYVEPDAELVGAAGLQELIFEAVGVGTGSIELWYVRGFDDPPDPAERARFTVTVGE